MNLRIAFTCTEYFSYASQRKELRPTNAHGGFGFLTKVKAEYLARKGFDVHVLVPAINFYENKNDELDLNGVHMHIYKDRSNSSKFVRNARGLLKLNHNKFLEELLNEIKPDIIQSEDTPPFNILINKPRNIPFILVFQDPYDFYDINLLLDSEVSYKNIPVSGELGYEMKPQNYNFNLKRVINVVHERNFIKPFKKFLRNSEDLKVYAEAECIAEKSKNMFSLPKKPDVLLNPISVKNVKWYKYDKPTVCWVARWDPQKRPDMALLIAQQIPEVRFIMIGTANRNLAHYEIVEEYLKKRFSNIRNLEVLGFVTEEEKREIIGKSWAMLNTSVREGLPITFLEALVEGTPIISYVDPDKYVSRFGIRVEYNVDSFVQGIKNAVSKRMFEIIGDEERAFALREHSSEVVMSKHIQIYRELLEK